MDDKQRTEDAAMRRDQRQDSRYVDVKGGPSDERRYLVQLERPNLIGAYQTARLPDHIRIGQINAEGFTATEEEAGKVWAYLDEWEAERRGAMRRPGEPGGVRQPNAVLERELTQQELGNVPPGSRQASQEEMETIRAGNPRAAGREGYEAAPEE